MTMKKATIFIITILTALIFAPGNLLAQTDSCLNLINGALKGQPGNIQDNMFHSLMIDPNNPNIIYSGTEANGMFKSTDGGQTWRRLRQGLKCTAMQTGYSQIFNITADPTTSSIIYASTVNGPGPATGILYPSASAGVYKSDDNGSTWQQRNVGFTNTYNSFLLVNPSNSQELFAAIGGLKSTLPASGGQFFTGGFYKSTNAGSSWTKLNTPLLADSNAVWNAVYTKMPQPVIYTSWHTHDAGISSLGLIKSLDNGNSWSVINPPGVVIGNFDVFKKNNNYIIATDNSPEHWAYASSNGGMNWTPLNKKFYGEFKIHPSDSSIVFFLGGGKNINRTTNGFQSTQTVYTDNDLSDVQPRQYMQDIKISESSPNIVWACAQGYFLYKSTDGGNSFTKITAVRDSIYSVVSGAVDLTSDKNDIVIYPNPFENAVSIQINLKRSEKVSLGIFNATGQKVKTIIDNILLVKGIYKYDTDFSSVPAGIYYAVLINDNSTTIKKMIQIR